MCFPYAVQGHEGKLVFGLIGPAKTPVVLLVGRAQSVSLSLEYCHIDMGADAPAVRSFYEGHTMGLVTFATRVCKVLGVETMIGALSCVHEKQERSLI